MGDEREPELARAGPGVISSQCSPPSSLRYTPQWFCWYSVSGCPAAAANLCTHWPVTGFGSGLKSARTPLLRGSHVAPPSRVSNTPTAEIPTQTRSAIGGVGDDRVQDQARRCPAAQPGRVGWSRRPATWLQVTPPSALRNRPAGSTPA